MGSPMDFNGNTHEQFSKVRKQLRFGMTGPCAPTPPRGPGILSVHALVPINITLSISLPIHMYWCEPQDRQHLELCLKPIRRGTNLPWPLVLLSVCQLAQCFLSWGGNNRHLHHLCQSSPSSITTWRCSLVLVRVEASSQNWYFCAIGVHFLGLFFLDKKCSRGNCF